MNQAPGKPSKDYRYAVISRRIWNDSAFLALSPIPPCGQGLFLRLLTTPEASIIPGLVPTGRAALAEALRWPQEGFDEAFAEASREGMVKADWNARLVWVPKAFNHNKPGSPNVVRAWVKAFNDIPDSPLKTEAWQALGTLCATLGPEWSAAFDGRKAAESTVSKPSPKASVKASGKASPKPSPKGYPEGFREGFGSTFGEPDSDSDSDSDLSASHSPGEREADPPYAGRTPADRMLDSLGTPPAESRLQTEVIRRFDAAWHRATGVHLGTNARSTPNVERARELLVWARNVDPADPLGAIERAAERAGRDTKAAKADAPFPWFCGSPGKYLEPPPAIVSPLDAELRQLASESNRLLREADVAASNGDRATRTRLTRESQALAQRVEQLRAGAA